MEDTIAFFCHFYFLFLSKWIHSDRLLYEVIVFLPYQNYFLYIAAPPLLQLVGDELREYPASSTFVLKFISVMCWDVTVIAITSRLEELLEKNYVIYQF